MQLFDEVWSAYDKRYAFFELGKIDWDAMRLEYRSKVAASSTDADAARLIGAMIGRLNDYHADLTTPFGVFGPPPIPYPAHFSAQVIRANYLADSIRFTPSGRMYYARLRSGQGYVNVPSFEGRGWGSEIEQVITDLPGITGLIVDIRNNGGGLEDNAMDIAARLYDRSHPYRVTRFRSGAGHGDFTPASIMSLAPAGAVHFGGPVALITNRFDGSSAEDFTLMLRALPNAVTVGDTTLGAASNPLSLQLDNGWRFRVPQSMQSTPDGYVYQWRGLPPGIAVPWDEREIAAGRDPYLAAAVVALARH
ncbi:MAG: S41 family peptidase [Gemmatimonadaceae bacterium]